MSYALHDYTFASGSTEALRGEEEGRRYALAEQRGRLTEWADIHRFVFAGSATFTLRSVETGARFTYKVRRAKEENRSGTVPYFVSLLRGPSNEEDYAYMGIVDERGFHPTAKSRVGPEAASHRAFQFLLARMKAGGAPCATMEFWHEGRCCRCGRKLTVPESVQDGVGPECRERMAG